MQKEVFSFSNYNNNTEMQSTVITMKQASHYLLLCILLVTGLSSCHKDIDEMNDTTTTTPPPNVVMQSEGNVVGYIYDEEDQPIAGAEVSIFGRTTETDEHGVFVMRGTTLDRNGTYIVARKNGYIIGSDMIYPGLAPTSYSYIKMMRLSTDQSFSGTAGGQIEIQGGGVVSFPSDAITFENGDLYSGEVVVTAKRIAADDEDLENLMPGGLIAEDKDGYTRVLGTLGMVAVELRDPNGNELILAEGKRATISFPITDQQLVDAPEQIPLWSFDEEKGIWREEGFATKNGNLYIGEVSHFSFWNCDAPFPLIHICGTAVYQDGTPAAAVTVKVETNAIYPVAYGITGSDGTFCGKMPKDEVLTITFFYQGCDNEGHTITVGPFSNDTDLGEIVLPATAFEGILTGTVVCNGDPVTDASIVISIDELTVVFLAEEDGSFVIDGNLFGCLDIVEANIFAINNTTGESSIVQSYSLEENATIVINTCGDCDLEITIEEEILDPCTTEGYMVTAVATGGSGNYEYVWNNGETSATITPTQIGLYCATVTDLDNDCSEAKCIEFQFFAIQDSSYVVNHVQCNGDLGQIHIEPFGGTPPYTYETLNEDGITISTSADVVDLSPGVYTAIATDANGCTSQSTLTIVEDAGINSPIIYAECDSGGFFIPDNGTGPYIIELDGVTYENEVFGLPSGEYCYIVTNSLGCTLEGCETIIVEETPNPSINTTCEFPFYRLNFDNLYTGIYTNSMTTISFDLTEFVDINPVDFGYQGVMSLSFSSQSQCWIDVEIDLPSYAGMTVDGSETSCDTCNDGYVSVDLNPDIECDQCEVGEYAIYSISDINFVEDLRIDNDNQSLPSGEYVVVLLDAESGCIIAHEIVNL